MLFENGYKTAEKRRGTNLLLALRVGGELLCWWLKIVAFLLKGAGRGERSREEARKSSLKIWHLSRAEKRKKLCRLNHFCHTTLQRMGGYIALSRTSLLCFANGCILHCGSALLFHPCVRALLSFCLICFTVFLCALM